MKLVLYILFCNRNIFKCECRVYFFFWRERRWVFFLRYICKVFAKCLGLLNGCMSILLLFFRGGGGFLLFLRFVISLAILYHCLGRVLGSDNVCLSF